MTQDISRTVWPSTLKAVSAMKGVVTSTDTSVNMRTPTVSPTALLQVVVEEPLYFGSVGRSRSTKAEKYKMYHREKSTLKIS